jgi:putative FmdB family regulatory protein
MPTYVYKCEDCEEVSEVMHSMSLDGPVACPKCGSFGTTKMITCPGIVLDWKDYPLDEGPSLRARSRYRGPAVQPSLEKALT